MSEEEWRGKKRGAKKKGRREREKKRKIGEAKHPRVSRVESVAATFSRFEIVMTVEYGQEYQRNLALYSSGSASSRMLQFMR